MSSRVMVIVFLRPSVWLCNRGASSIHQSSCLSVPSVGFNWVVVHGPRAKSHERPSNLVIALESTCSLECRQLGAGLKGAMAKFFGRWAYTRHLVSMTLL